MSATTVRRILAVTYGDIVRFERKLAEDVYPGQLLELTSGDQFQKHTTAGGLAVPWILDFDFGQGKDVDEVVSSGNKAFAVAPRRGEEAYVLLDQDENISVGDFLMSNGNGDFIKRATTEESSGGYLAGHSICQALEAVNVTDSSGAEVWNDYFIHVLFL